MSVLRREEEQQSAWTAGESLILRATRAVIRQLICLPWAPHAPCLTVLSTFIAYVPEFLQSGVLHVSAHKEPEEVVKMPPYAGASVRDRTAELTGIADRLQRQQVVPHASFPGGQIFLQV